MNKVLSDNAKRETKEKWRETKRWQQRERESVRVGERQVRVSRHSFDFYRLYVLTSILLLVYFFIAFIRTLSRPSPFILQEFFLSLYIYIVLVVILLCLFKCQSPINIIVTIAVTTLSLTFFSTAGEQQNESEWVRVREIAFVWNTGSCLRTVTTFCIWVSEISL